LTAALWIDLLIIKRRYAIDFLDFVSRYYPHEVSRAANLLLSGAVFNRAFQPYESHIPYLLHFLVDYNLYGMGHIHVKDFKFRPPWPDDFHPKSSFRRKAQSNKSEIKSPTVWISSTVSHCSILGSSATSHCLRGTNLSFAGRPSSSMLEADSRVEGLVATI